MRRASEDTFRAWAISQTLLVALLGAGLALFVTNPVLRTTWRLPEARLVLDTLVALAATLVAALAGVRFSVEGRKLDLILCAGFLPIRPRGAPVVPRHDPAAGILAAGSILDRAAGFELFEGGIPEVQEPIIASGCYNLPIGRFRQRPTVLLLRN